MNLETSDYNSSIQFIKDKYSELCPDSPIDYFYLDTDFENQYKAENSLNKIFRIFTVLGIFIACLGLFGLMLFITEKRTKEIGIRKVLGSSIYKIVFLLNKDLIKWMLISIILSWPIAYFSMNSWLRNFAYRTNVPLIVFIGATAIVLSIILLTVSFHSIKSATKNPVDTLRYE